MGRNLERLVEKARKERPSPLMIRANALPIFGDTEGDRAAQAARLIAAGKLAATDRPRCVGWGAFLDGNGPLTPEQLAFVRAQAEIAEAKVPDRDAAYVLTMARLLECLNPPDGEETAFGVSL